MKRIYIAGPMHGISHFNYPKFGEIATCLRLGGWEVVSPGEIGNRFGTAQQINDNPDLLAKVIGAKGELAGALAHGLQIILEGPRHVMR